MLLPISLLKQYVDTKLQPEQLGEKFLMTSSELESITNLACERRDTFDYVVVGKVLRLKPHPNAQKLQVCQVDAGDKGVLQVVCGAANVVEGMYAPLALVGAKVLWHGGAEVILEAADLRGVPSYGMLCAAEELGLPVQHSEGLWQLEKSKPGTPLLTALGLADSVLDLEITPNRPDLLSYEGLAREVQAYEGRTLTTISPVRVKPGHQLEISIAVESSSSCSRMSAVALELTDLPQHSPWWLQKALILSGIKPNHPVVDVTNFVMLEIGQPMHAYDLAQLQGPALQVKTLKKKTSFTGLDDVNRELGSGDIVICQGKNILALAGIMGGAQSAISSDTKQILLEAAHFQPAHIRRTSRRLGLRSEASLRFEKGTDAANTLRAVYRATELLSSMGKIEVISDYADTGVPTRQTPKISFVPQDFESIIGARVSVPEARRILESLGFTIVSASKSKLICSPPSWRADILLIEDVYEEVVRIWGYDRVPATLASGKLLAPRVNQQFFTEQRVLHNLAKIGFQNLVSQPFINSSSLENVDLPPTSALALSNPLSTREGLLSPSYLPIHLNLIQKNQLDEYSRYSEIGSTFHSQTPHERRVLALTLRGPKEEAEYLLREMKRAILTAVPASEVVQESIILAGKAIGKVTCLPSSVTEAFKIRRNGCIIFAELTAESLISNQNHTYSPEPLFPTSSRDETFSLNSRTYKDLESSLRGVKVKYLIDMQLLSTFRKEESLMVTMRFTYGAHDKTLTEAEIETDHTVITQAGNNL